AASRPSRCRTSRGAASSSSPTRTATAGRSSSCRRVPEAALGSPATGRRGRRPPTGERVAVSIEAGVRVIYLIRHAEKPGTTEGRGAGVSDKAEGVTRDGKPNEPSLLPCGWQRAGALVELFAPAEGALREGVLPPTQLIAPKYTKEPALNYRTHETILPLA